jgi:hypothetical protein
MRILARSCFCAVVLAIVLGNPMAAQTTQQDNTGFGTSSAEFLLFGAGARGTALGGSVAALTTDVTALYYNPGDLALMSRPGIMVSSYSYLASTRYSWAGIGFPMSGGARALGVSVGTFGFGNQPVTTLEFPDGTGETYSVSQSFVAGTYSQNFSDRFSAGFSVKLISDKLGLTSATAFAVDFGTNFHASVGQRPIRGAFVVQNLGTNLKHSGSALDQTVLRQPPQGTVDVPQQPQDAVLKTSGWNLPTAFRVAVAIDLVTMSQQRLTLMGEFTQPNNNKPGAGAGLEYALANIGSSGISLAGRGSYTIQPANSLDPGMDAGFPTKYSVGSFSNYGLAAGGGIGWGRGDFKVALDYAYKSLGALGGTNFVSLALAW